MTFVFSVEIVNPFSFAYLDNVFVALCSRVFAVVGVLLLVRVTHLSAYPSIRVGPSIPLHISAIVRNRVPPCLSGVCFIFQKTYSGRICSSF
jgi:hypothetical protein